MKADLMVTLFEGRLDETYYCIGHSLPCPYRTGPEKHCTHLTQCGVCMQPQARRTALEALTARLTSRLAEVTE